jgi:diguanylate cyclase (GGDEF)-like protein
MAELHRLPNRILLPLVVTIVATMALLGLQFWWAQSSAGLIRALDPGSHAVLVRIEIGLERLGRAVDRSSTEHDGANVALLASGLARDVARLRAAAQEGRLQLVHEQIVDIDRLAHWLATARPGTEAAPAAEARATFAALSQPIADIVVEARERAAAAALGLERRSTVMIATTTALGGLLLVAGISLLRLVGDEFGRRQRELLVVQAAHGRARHEASHDPLTGLPNRRQLEREMAARFADAGGPDGRSFAVHLVDLDDLKGINDGHGHAAGDRVLQAFGRALARSVRRSDFVARIGGDEFVVLQHDANPQQAEAMVVRLTDRVRRPVRLADGTVVVPSASIGVGLFGVDGTTCEALLEAADRRLYAAKGTAGGASWRAVREVAVPITS